MTSTPYSCVLRTSRLDQVRRDQRVVERLHALRLRVVDDDADVDARRARRDRHSVVGRDRRTIPVGGIADSVDELR
jgi:hypothetical protein